MKINWRLSNRVTSWTQKGEKQESNGRKRRGRAGGNPKDVLRAIFRVNHYGLFTFPTNRNNDRSNVRTQYKT